MFYNIENVCGYSEKIRIFAGEIVKHTKRP